MLAEAEAAAKTEAVVEAGGESEAAIEVEAEVAEVAEEAEAGATIVVLASLLAGVRVVLVFRVFVMELVYPTPGTILVSRIEVVMIPVVPMEP